MRLFQYLIPALIGLMAGMLVNYLSDVLPVSRRFSSPICLNCHVSQPFTNYFWWPRKCLDCGRRRSWRTWSVEGIFIALTIWLWLSPPERMDGSFVWSLLVLVYFGVVIVIDLEHLAILHQVSAFGLILGLILGTILHGFFETILGGLGGFGIMYALYFLGGIFARWVARRRGENLDEDALGFGDVNLGGVLGLILGWPGIIAGLTLAFMTGGVFAFFYLLAMLLTRKYSIFKAFPYGPFMVLSAFLLMYLQIDLILAGY